LFIVTVACLIYDGVFLSQTLLKTDVKTADHRIMKRRHKYFADDSIV